MKTSGGHGLGCLSLALGLAGLLLLLQAVIAFRVGSEVKIPTDFQSVRDEFGLSPLTALGIGAVMLLFSIVGIIKIMQK